MQARRFALVALVALAFGVVGCQAVPQAEYDALQMKYNALDDQNQDLTLQLQDAKSRESQLLAEVVAAKQRTTRAEVEATRLRNQQTAAPKLAPVAPAAPAPAPMEVSMGSDTLFAPGKARLTSSGRSRVAKLAGRLKREYPGTTVVVYGHTDSDKITKSGWKDNLDLSAQRAMAVTRALVKAGIPAKQIETVAMGEHHPVVPNKGSANKAKNRRVVVKVRK